MAKKPHKLTRGATNKTKQEDPKQGKRWEKLKLYSLHLSQKLFWEKTRRHPFHFVWKVVLYLCFVRIVQHVKSSGHTGTAQFYLCVCVPCQTISAGLLKVFAAFLDEGGRGEVGPLEALCRPFNDAASGKFVQIVYGYCTCIHTEHTPRETKRDRKGEMEHFLFTCSGGL